MPKDFSIKNFDSKREGLCFGCGCECGYILYLKGGKVIDVYGNPKVYPGMGSLCSKGIAYLYEGPSSPFRIRSFLVREGENFKEISREEAKSLIRQNLKEKVAVFVSPFFSLEDLKLFSRFDLYSDYEFVPFKPSTLKPWLWPQKKFILALFSEFVFSDVMLERFVIDAKERGAKVIGVSSLRDALLLKSSESYLLNLKELKEFLEGVLERYGKEFESLPSLVLIGDALLKSPLRNLTLKLLKVLRENFKVDYSIVGNVFRYPHRGLKEFKENLKDYESFILFGNPARYLNDQELKLLKEKFVISVTPFPNLTALNSRLILPMPLFHERDYLNLFSPYSELRESKRTLDFTPGYLEVLLDLLGEGEVLAFEEEEEISFKDEDVNLKGEVFYYYEEGLTPDYCKWFYLTYPLEGQRLLISQDLNLSFKDLKVERTKNLAKGTIFLQSSFEEYQPFLEGVRIGKLLKTPYYKLGVFK